MKRIAKNKLIIYSIIIFILFIPASFANGGCIKIIDDILVQLSISPIVPIVNKEASFLISFGNREGLVNEEITGRLWITEHDEKILTKDFKIKDGILDLKHRFKKEGLYELFLEFDYKSKTYTPEDFLIDVKEERQSVISDFIFLIIGMTIGAVAIKLIKK